ncbi:MAG: 30S ribosomal protein S6 [Gemmatimonadetes bacterium]|nr:30S ribosomal protein S6 [Gemmatimonadota bacterium]NIQ58057.1 30S ribosomal protein S6 [Gemmatimonadota bacterium]NIU78240.1 30S ribosomal protein S6 [Gammaproteobacteria bacterium]NIX47225.1 30S ribosomal protein S6 [Gemmatimonadota bacterium]NIY11598.1 30S ribosomal protein S6 [Gemmatimonadota bacterium]
MREYEIVYIFDPVLTEDQVNEKLEKFHQHITDGGGEITAVDHWGKRQLAYPINKKTSGYYVVVQFTAEASSLPELERTLKLDDDLVRYLIVLSEGEPTAAMSIATREPSRSDDDEDDEDEDEDEEED